MPNDDEMRDCPYCREEISVEASKCRYCGSSVAPEMPSHAGTCPYCKEEIHEEAVKCKHCGSNLTVEADVRSGQGVEFADYDHRGLAPPDVPSERVESVVGALYRSRFPSTLPKCRWVPKVCGSSLPGYPPITCGYEYVCRYGNQDVVISQEFVSDVR